ncbi:MAG: 50S ribosomal protein L28 [Patescibacteria group bacterium]
MARVCQICGKGSKMVGKRKLLRGNYNPTVKTRKYPNLQWLTLASGKRVKACAQCFRTHKKKLNA